MIQSFVGPALPDVIQAQLRLLLEDAFPGFFEGRIYVKQQPHVRIVILDGDVLIGHVALDYRVIQVGTDVVPICGVIDLCVRTDRRGAGRGSGLLREAERQARAAQVAFMVLMAHRHDVYRRHGFVRIRGTTTRWLAIEDRASHSLTEQDLSDCFMAKSLMGFSWPDGKIDMLGYLF